MEIQEQQIYQDNSHHEIDIKELLPANPIYQKPVKQLPKPVLKVELIKNQNIGREVLRPNFKKSQQSSQDESIDFEEDQSSFLKYYKNYKCIYLKFDNKQYNNLNRTEYYSSMFIDRRLFQANKNPLNNINQLLTELFNEDFTQRDQNLSKNQIKFSSNFESGNLFAVFKKTSNEYDLILQNDINSKGNTQWFYFSISNLPKDIEITFNIVNLLKSDSLFNYGMQPVVLSQIRNEKNKQGWVRSGRQISYFKNSIKKEKSKKFYHTLSFKLTNKIINDTLYVAHCFPYTYTMLKEYLNNIMKTQKRGSFLKGSLGKTIGNHNIELVTITQPCDKKKDNRKIIVILARQHPGQTQGSYVCQGIIDFLISKSKQAEFIKKNYIIKIIPMVNPDGVIFGNYRSNLGGCDLNRKWDLYDRQGLFPEVSCIKSYINQLNKQHKIKFILDLHGHSKKLNSFFYGNPNLQHPEVVRSFPYVCSKINPQISFEDCTFAIQETKKQAARVYLGITHQLIYVYTFQSSFYGYTKDNKKYAFRIEEYKNLGNSLCLGLYSLLEHEFYTQLKTPQKSASVFSKYLTQLRQNFNLINMGDKNESGSQSNPDQCQMIQKQIVEIANKSSILNINTDDFEENKIFELPKTQKLAALTTKKISKNQIKQWTKNSKQLRVLELNRVDSILPDKYQMALQPTSFFSKQKQLQKDRQQYKKKKFRKSFQYFKVSIHTQTTSLSEEIWQKIKPISILYVQSDQSELQYQPLTFYKDNVDLKYVELIDTQRKIKKKSLKQDLVDKVSSLGHIFILKNTYTQTILSFSTMKNQKNKSITNLPEIQQKEGKNSDKFKMQILKTTRLIGKRQNKDILNEMIRKYLSDVRERHLRPFNSTNELPHNNKSLSTKIEDSSERPLSIKKKEILFQKKIFTPKKYEKF